MKNVVIDANFRNEKNSTIRVSAFTPKIQESSVAKEIQVSHNFRSSKPITIAKNAISR
jgi:hypothetical protein